jgi:hypothetical protein
MFQMSEIEIFCSCVTIGAVLFSAAFTYLYYMRYSRQKGVRLRPYLFKH